MIHLKVRTEYSFGQTFAPISRVIARLKEAGATAAGIVDRDSTWGHVHWWRSCHEAGIQPLLGVELVVNDGDLSQRMWFLAKNKAGLAELYRVVSKGHRQPITYRQGSIPRLYERDVLGMSKNIFIFAGDRTDEPFLREAGAIMDLSPASLIVNAAKERHSKWAKVVEVDDNAFAYPEDAATFELMSRAALKVTPQYLRSELKHQSVAAKIAKECAGLELNKAPMVRAEGRLEALCREGISARRLVWNDQYEERMLYELDLIKSKDFESYFIIVADMVQFAKKHMLVGPSRGSAAGSLVCYLTRITEIDPIPPKLYFERFIDVSRTDLPDIDLDFPDDKRYMVFEYMAEKYGVNNVAHIGTISQFRPKSALIQVCKTLGIPPSATAGVKTAMIERSSADSRANNCLQDTFETTKPGQEFIKLYPNAQAACLIEGHASHTGVHAAGLIVCNDDINNYAVVDADGIAHIDKGSAEYVGLLKIDVLGLRTLGVLEDSGAPVDWYNLPFDDQKTFDIFNQQKLCGIFQFEGNALRAISRAIKFSSISDIDAVTALARPGPFGGGVTEKYVKRRNGEKYQPIHPLVEQQMAETYGLPVYQEQTLAIVREIGKFDWKETSTIRKAMSKRMGKEFFDAYWEKFKLGAASQGIGEKEARAAWETINAMGAWQMNKAHTFSYAVISYWTAYLKAHHPLEFAAANLRNAKDEDTAVQLLREMTREGIEYVAFDIDRSAVNWSVQDGKLVGGFMCLKGFGESKAAKFIEARVSGKLTKKQREKAAAAENTFADLFPFMTKYGDMYNNPRAHGIAGDLRHIIDIEDIGHKDQVVFLGEVVYKNARNANEEVNVKKRNGKFETGPLEFVDVRLRDDTGTIGGRIGRYDFERIGRKLLELVPIGAHIMVRAEFYNGIRYAFIKKWKRIDE